MSGGIVKAPWTAEQVKNLNDYQHFSGLHPFTCAGGGGPHHGMVLVAEEDGWHCLVDGCWRRQDWAMAWMAATAWRRRPEPDAELRAASAHMRGSHGPDHPRHDFWNALADLLDLTADASERLGVPTPVIAGPGPLAVARAYLAANA